MPISETIENYCQTEYLTEVPKKSLNFTSRFFDWFKIWSLFVKNIIYVFLHCNYDVEFINERSTDKNKFCSKDRKSYYVAGDFDVGKFDNDKKSRKEECETHLKTRYAFIDSFCQLK